VAKSLLGLLDVLKSHREIEILKSQSNAPQRKKTGTPKLQRIPS